MSRLTVLLLLVATAVKGEQLAVFDDGAWKAWWHSETAPVRWQAAYPPLIHAVTWKRLRPGLDVAEVPIAARSALRLQIVLLRIDPRHFSWELVERRDAAAKPAWQVEDASPNAAFAFNAGQFTGGRPWGWIIADGREVQPPGTGPLSMALVIDASHQATLVGHDEIEAVRHRGDIITAFQSYPALLEKDGVVPQALRSEASAVDVRHRDSRLAVGELRDGRIVVALTRFDIGGGLLRPVPIGPNLPEMAAIMGALGCRRAVMLDGGISSQMLARGAEGPARIWSAYRRVPMGVVATPLREK